ncbi:hypothetical protein [Kitasatospora sp. NPDC093679]|uniref:hypothetical protein n=1 Tax=Kitasatospora sp. NPDC093679 TaxID=3154983 RepID=UPI003414277D
MNPSARKAQALILKRRRMNGLAASTKRRPRSLATYALATGADRETAGGVADALRSVAKRLKVEPEVREVTRRTLAGGRAPEMRPVSRYSRAQVRQIAEAYRPRKAEYKEIQAGLLRITAA